MSLCASCGLEIIDGSELCRHHVPLADEWAQSNRIMCDFFHRKRIPPARFRIPPPTSGGWTRTPPDFSPFSGARRRPRHDRSINRRGRRPGKHASSRGLATL
jgi:hypothetical protein